MLLNGLAYGFCDSNISELESFLSNDLNTRGNGLKNSTEQFHCEIRYNFYHNWVAKVWNDLLHSLVTVFNTNHWHNQLNNEEMLKTIKKWWCVRLFVLEIRRFHCEIFSCQWFFFLSFALCIFLYFPLSSLIWLFLYCIVCTRYFAFCVSKSSFNQIWKIAVQCEKNLMNEFRQFFAKKTF